MCCKIPWYCKFPSSEEYGDNAILRPIIEDIQKLGNGCPLVIDGEEKLVFGIVISCAGDTEGQHEWSGYKVGVGFAFHKCRHCQCHYDAMQQSFYDYDFHAGQKRHMKNTAKKLMRHRQNKLRPT